MQRILLALIRAYRYVLSPWTGQQCRFTPTCSVYAMQAIDAYGPGRGSWLALRRLLRCHPLCQGGHDPVPGLDADTALIYDQVEKNDSLAAEERLENNDQTHTEERKDHA